MSPKFLSPEEILIIHQDQIYRYGGSRGIRDKDGLLSAISQPSVGTTEGYLHKDLFEMAAAYLFHIVQNHPFVDGNKRTGVVAALMFLELNGLELLIGEESLEKSVYMVAEGKWDKRKVSQFLRSHSKTQKYRPQEIET